jgi:hypothetical protein
MAYGTNVIVTYGMRSLSYGIIIGGLICVQNGISYYELNRLRRDFSDRINKISLYFFVS